MNIWKRTAEINQFQPESGETKKGIEIGLLFTVRALQPTSNRIQKFEQTGEITLELFNKLAGVLGIEKATVDELAKKDLEAWAKPPIHDFA